MSAGHKPDHHRGGKLAKTLEVNMGELLHWVDTVGVGVALPAASVRSSHCLLCQQIVHQALNCLAMADGFAKAIPIQLQWDKKLI